MVNKLRITKLISLIALLLFTTWSSAQSTGPILKTEQEAIQVAVSIAQVIYGSETIKDQQPYKATLDDDIWTVRGSLHYDKGGVFEIKLQRTDCRVINFSHGK